MSAVYFTSLCGFVSQKNNAGISFQHELVVISVTSGTSVPFPLLCLINGSWLAEKISSSVKTSECLHMDAGKVSNIAVITILHDHRQEV
jgi:hypothetical protein